MRKTFIQGQVTTAHLFVYLEVASRQIFFFVPNSFNAAAAGAADAGASAACMYYGVLGGRVGPP